MRRCNVSVQASCSKHFYFLCMRVLLTNKWVFFPAFLSWLLLPLKLSQPRHLDLFRNVSSIVLEVQEGAKSQHWGEVSKRRVKAMWAFPLFCFFPSPKNVNKKSLAAATSFPPHDKTGASSRLWYATDPFTSNDVPRLDKSRQSTDFLALKMWKGRSGSSD